MSISKIPTLISRIQIATPKSPIAVFVTRNKKGKAIKGTFRAVFAATEETKREILESPEEYIGTFHRDMDLERVKQILEAC